MSYTEFKEKRIYFEDSGEGQTIVLLHGFTESLNIWKQFVMSLSKEFRIITIDLPGHGKSDCLAEVHSMELLAAVVHDVLANLNVRQCVMVGHSMGGYTTLEFAAKYPDMLKGICIFHSHCFADSQEDKENRNRTIQFVRQDKFSFIIQFIAGLFPAEVQEIFSREIEELIGEAENMSKEAVIAALEGMKNRADHSALLHSTNLPVLFILGLKDTKAPVSRYWEMISLPVHSESLILREVGHMGYIESPEETLQAIRHFALRLFL